MILWSFQELLRLVQDGGNFLLIKEVLEDSKEYWIVPDGKVIFGETISDAAKREIKEELGIDIKNREINWS